MHLTLQCLQNIICLYSRSMCLFDVRPTLHMLRFIHFLSLRWVPLAFNYFQILFSITERKMNTNICIESMDIDRNVEVLDKFPCWSIFWWEGSGHLSFYKCVRRDPLWLLFQQENQTHWNRAKQPLMWVEKVEGNMSPSCLPGPYRTLGWFLWCLQLASVKKYDLRAWLPCNVLLL